MKKTIGKFKVEYLQVLDENGKVDKKLEPKLSKEDLIKLYKNIVLTKTFDDIGLKLQREGRMGTYAPVKGQEAQVGSAFALQKSDWMFPSFREHGVYLTRGLSAKHLYLYFMGSEEGGRIPKGNNDLTMAVPVGTHLVHAVGASWAAKIKGHKIGIAVYFGDGATSEGDFHEALNFAGVFQTPTVFLCQNNQWAISLPRSKQSAAKTLAQKAIAYGFEGIQIDGNDILAQYVATKKALEKARAGKGPTFIELLTYRMSMHTTADDPKKYRSEAEVKKWEKRDPLKRFKIYLKKKKILNEKLEKEIQDEATKIINKAVAEAESMPKPAKEDMFKYVYEKIPKDLQEQMKE